MTEVMYRSRVAKLVSGILGYLIGITYGKVNARFDPCTLEGNMFVPSIGKTWYVVSYYIISADMIAGDRYRGYLLRINGPENGHTVG